MAEKGFIKRIILANKNRLIVTYALFSLEMAGTLLKPYFIGEAVNDLVKGGYKMLLVFLFVHLAWVVVGMLRMRFDSRTYSQIYKSIVTQFLAKKKEERNISKLSAISTLTREYTDFLEYDLIFILEAFYNIFGSLIFIYFADKRVILLCIIVLIPVIFLSKYYGKKMGNLTQLKNDELEKQVEVITSYDDDKMKTHYNLLQKWQVKIADQHAFNFGIMEMFVMILLGVSLIISTRYSNVTMNAGEIISFYLYILKFTTGLDTIPYITEKYATLKDINRRIHEYIS